METIGQYLARNSGGVAPRASRRPSISAWVAQHPPVVPQADPEPPPVQEDDSDLFLDTVVPTAIRVLPAIAGGMAGGALGLPALGIGAVGGAAAGGAAGAGLGETAAELYEKARGTRKELSPAQIAFQTGLGAIPITKSATVTRAALKAGGLGLAGAVGTPLMEGERPTVEGALTGTALGLLLGGGTHWGAQKLTRLKAVRQARAERVAADAAEAARWKEPVFDPQTGAYREPVRGAAEGPLAAFLRGETGEPVPQWTRASDGLQPTPVAQRRPDLAKVMETARAGVEPPVVGPRGSIRAYLARDAQIQAELRQPPAPPAPTPVPTTITREMADALAERGYGEAAINALSPEDADRILQEPFGQVQADLPQELREAAARTRLGNRAAEVAAARLAQTRQAEGVPELQRLLTPADVDPAKAQAELADILKTRAGSAAPPAPLGPAAQTRLAEMLRMEQGPPSIASQLEEAAPKGAMLIGERKFGPRVTTPANPNFAETIAAGDVAAGRATVVNGKVVRVKGAGKVLAPLDVNDRHYLDSVARAFDREPPNFLNSMGGGDSPLQPFFDMVREAGGNPKWTNSEIRAAVRALRGGKESLVGRAALTVAKETFAGPFPSRAPAMTEGMAERIRRDQEIAAGIAAERTPEQVAAAKAAQEAAAAKRAEQAFFDHGVQYPEPTSATTTIPRDTFLGAGAEAQAEAAAQKIRDAGGKAHVGGDKGYYTVYEEVARNAGREPGQEGFAGMRPLFTLGGGAAGGVVGGTQGDTPEERMKNAALGALLGMGAGYAGARAAENPAALRKLLKTGGLAGEGERGSIPIGKGKPVASAAEVKKIPGWRLGWGTFKHRLMDRLGVPQDQFNSWDVPAEWQAAYKEASGRGAAPKAAAVPKPAAPAARPGDRVQSSIEAQADEIAAMDSRLRDETNFYDKGMTKGYLLYEARTKMPKAAGTFRRVNDNNSFMLYQEADGVVNHNGEPLLAHLYDDPDWRPGDPKDSKYIWAFSKPGTVDVVETIENDLSAALASYDAKTGAKAAAPVVPGQGKLFGPETGAASAGVQRGMGAAAGAVVGGAAGAATGDTPEERLQRGLAGAAIGAGGMLAAGKLAGKVGAVETKLSAAAAKTPEELARADRAAARASKGVVERREFGLDETAKRMAKELVPPAKPIEQHDLYTQRLDKFDDTARPVLDAILKGEKGFTAQRRNVQPIARTQALADVITVNLDRPGPVGKAYNAEQLTAMRNAMATLAHQVKDEADVLAQMGIKPGADLETLTAPQSQALMNWATTQQALEVVQKTLTGGRAEAGRALAAFRFMARMAPGDEQVVRQVLRRGRFDEALVKMAGIWTGVDKNDPVAVYKALRDVTKRGLMDRVSGYWMANVLSGIKTQERNLLGNMSRLATNIVLKPTVAAPLDWLKAKTTGAERTVFAREAVDDLTGALHSTGKAWNDFWYTLRNGFSEEWLNTALDLEGGFTPRAEFIGGGRNPWNMPGRFLDAADRGFYQLNAGAERYSQSYGIARAEANKLHLTGEARTSHIANRMAELRTKAMPLEMQQSVHQAALEATYRENPGRFTQILTQMRREVPGMTFVVPFINTVANIFRQGYEFTPVSGLVKGARYAAGNTQAWNRAGGGAREATMMQAKALAGSIASAQFAYWAVTGRLSGAGPTDRANRAQLMATGWRPNSIKLPLSDRVAALVGASKSNDGEYWVNYSLFQPLAVPASIVANAVESWNEVNAQAVKRTKPQAASSIVAQTLARVAKSGLNQSYLQGMFTLADAVNNGQMSADKLVEQIAQGFMPGAGLLRNLTQMKDPVIRDPSGLMEALKANVPVASETVAPKLGRFGEPIERSGTWWRRGGVVPEVEPTTNDWIDKELVRLNMNVGTPTDRLTIPEWLPNAGRKISSQESAAIRQARGRSIRAMLSVVMQSPGYQRMPDWARTQLVKRAINSGSTVASRAARIGIGLQRPDLLQRLVGPMNRLAAQSYAPGQRKGT